MTLGRLYFVIIVALLYVAFSPPKIIHTFELRLYDLLVQWTAPQKPDPNIVVVGIDQKSLDQFGRWPWPRNVIGDLVVKLADYGVAVTALDVGFPTDADKGTAEVMDELGQRMTAYQIDEKYPEFFSEYQQVRQSLSKDESLANSIDEAGNVVTGVMFDKISQQADVSRELQAKKLESIKPFAIPYITRDLMSANSQLWGAHAIGDVEPNIPIIQEASAASGFFNATSDEDGVYRAHPMVIEKDGVLYPSLSLAAVALYMGANPELTGVFEEGLFTGVDIVGQFFETTPEGSTYLRYYGKDETFPLVSAADVMNGDIDDPGLRLQLENKIIFVGATALQLYDQRITPMGVFAGVEIHATAAGNALTNTVIHKLPWQRLYDVALTLIFGIVLFFVLRRTSTLAGLILTGSLFAGLGLFNYYAFSEWSLWLNTIVPSMMLVIGFTTVTVWNYIAEQKSKRFIHDAFGRYLSPKVISQIIENPRQLKLGGDKRMMTAFFSDVAGFTTISEKLSPAQLVKLLNQYLSEMTDIIHHTDGTLDKYEGDAIIAFWGAPIPVENHAEQCVLSAVRQQRKLTELREEWRKKGKDELAVRIGINTGPMVVGNMGSKERMDYTMIGDAVNLAARLEGANKYYGSYILISEYTYEEVRTKFLCRQLDIVRVQGKKEPIRLYEVVEELGMVNDGQRRLARYFEQALNAFHNLDFTVASKLFERCDKLRAGGDIACKLYLTRCAELIESPPPDDWDRVYDLAK